MQMKKVLLLDLGGVLADLASPAESMRLSMTNDEFWQIWLNSASVAAYETGRIDLEIFSQSISTELGIADADDVIERFQSWQLSVFPGVERILGQAANQFRLALLSNTNPTHWEQIRSSSRLCEIFEKLFLSFETGTFKPERAAFTQVLDYFKCPVEDVFFLDDSASNVAAARSLGIQAAQVMGSQQLEMTIDRIATEDVIT